jgi:hypothetical protein
MNLLMCCTPLGREDKYLQELRYVVIASIFFKRLYPDGKVYVGTTPNANIPKYLSNFFEAVEFPFDKAPFAIARQVFYRDFINSSLLTTDTLITGCDVLFTKKIELDIPHQMAMTYRYHRTQPYCSDFLLVKKEFKELAGEFCNEVIKTMTWFPKEIQQSWADQLSIAIEMGFLKKEQFNGEIQKSPKQSDILLLPGNKYLYTPNDFFSSVAEDKIEQIQNDTPDFKLLLNHSNNKTAIHFKGNRKYLFFIFAYLCKVNNIVNFDKYDTCMTDDYLFKEYFEHQSKFKDSIINQA